MCLDPECNEYETGYDRGFETAKRAVCALFCKACAGEKINRIQFFVTAVLDDNKWVHVGSSTKNRHLRYSCKAVTVRVGLM